jgi:alpha/beta superfamily hydrolase
MLGGTGRTASDAMRVDERTGVRERAAFVSGPSADEQIFMCSHEPPTDPVGAVLICSPVLADFLSHYQREVNLARSLAEAGFTVARFHYRGTGNSDGDNALVTLSSLEADALWMAEELRSWLPDVPLAVVGTRLSSLVAASVARDHPEAAVVLCEPVTDPRRYFQDGIRSAAMASIASGRARQGSGDLAAQIDRDGSVDILGNLIHRDLYQTTVAVDPTAFLLAAGQHPALLMQFGGRDLRAPLRSLKERLGEGGWDLDASIIDLQESWWFRAGRRLLSHPELNSSVETWLVRQMAREGAR